MDEPALLVEPVSPDDPHVVGLIRAQMRELMETWNHRPVTDEEVDAELGPQATAGIALLVLASRAGEPLGCGGLRVVEAWGELTKVYVVPSARGRGVADAVVGALEDAARDRGLRAVRLDTRADLPAPRRLYRRLGYTEVAPWHDRPYADHFFHKDL